MSRAVYTSPALFDSIFQRAGRCNALEKAKRAPILMCKTRVWLAMDARVWTFMADIVKSIELIVNNERITHSFAMFISNKRIYFQFG